MTISGTGHWLLYAFADDAGGPGLWYTTGPVSLTVDTDGLLTSLDVGHKAVDLCEVLGG